MDSEEQILDVKDHHEFVKKLLDYNIKYELAKKLYFPPGKKGISILVDEIVIQWINDKFVAK